MIDLELKSVRINLLIYKIFISELTAIIPIIALLLFLFKHCKDLTITANSLI